MNNKQIIAAFSTLIFLSANLPAQTGENFTITQSVIAAGGENSTGGLFSLDGTAGQTVAGNAVRNSPFAVTSGFWNFTLAAPTAANVNIGGRVITDSSRGVRNAVVTLISPNGTIRSTRTGAFGFFKFENVAVGGTYVISASAKRFTFNQPTIVRTVQEEVSDMEFVANK